jgi:hypothetical protein
MIYAIFSEGEYPGRGWESGRKSRQTRRNHPIHTGRFEARGGVIHGRQWSTDSISFPRNEGRFTDPGDAEPWFLALNTSIEIHPVMVPDDLARASSAIEAAAKKYTWQSSAIYMG